MKTIGKIQYNSPVILTFAILSACVLGLGRLTGNSSTMYLFSVYRSPATNPLTYVRLFTHVIGHADMSHYLNNFLIILLIGPMLEEKYGAKKIIFMILITAVVTGTINIIFFNSVLLGASGIVFMFILLSSFVNLNKGRIPFTVILIMCVFLGREVIDGIFISDNVSHLSHIIGGFCGAVTGFYLNRGILFNGGAAEEA